MREVSRSRGKEPGPSAKAPKDMLSVARMWKCPDSQQVGLEAAILQRVRNSSLVEDFRAENTGG